MLPLVAGISPTSMRPVVDLPEPDSPTSPSVSPGAICEADIVHRTQMPAVPTGKSLQSASTATTGGVVMPAAAAGNG